MLFVTVFALHVAERKRRITGTGGKDKTAVMGILERGGKVRTRVVANRKKALLQAIVKEHVAPGAEVFTDALKSYEGLEDEYLHQFVDHAVEYVKGHVHTNGMENFWCLLKRSLKGTYISVAAYHLFRYVDEQAFLYNERNDERGDLARLSAGRSRLRWKATHIQPTDRQVLNRHVSSTDVTY